MISAAVLWGHVSNVSTGLGHVGNVSPQFIHNWCWKDTVGTWNRRGDLPLLPRRTAPAVDLNDLGSGLVGTRFQRVHRVGTRWKRVPTIHPQLVLEGHSWNLEQTRGLALASAMDGTSS